MLAINGRHVSRVSRKRIPALLEQRPLTLAFASMKNFTVPTVEAVFGPGPLQIEWEPCHTSPSRGAMIKALLPEEDGSPGPAERRQLLPGMVLWACDGYNKHLEPHEEVLQALQASPRPLVLSFLPITAERK